MNRSEMFERKFQKLSRKVRPWRETEQKQIYKALKAAEDDKILAADLLGISNNTLYRRLWTYESKETPPDTREPSVKPVDPRSP